MRLKIFTKNLSRIAAIASVFLMSFGSAQAQIDIGSVMEAGADDASKIVGAYMTPVLRGFGAGINQGWYNTAKPHGLGRFDITFSVNAAFVPDEDLFYDASKLGLTNLIIKPGTGPLAPTASGDDNFSNPAVFQLFDNTSGTQLAEFEAPPGIGQPYSGAPTVQLAVGLIKGTEVMVRYVPTLSVGDADIGLIGFGVKHDIKQWIPVVSKLPFDMSAYYGYTKFNSSYGLTIAPDAALNPYSGIASNDFSNQSMDLNTTASAMGLIVSKKLLALTVYAAVNYQTSKTTVDMLGNYPINVLEDQVGDPQFGQAVYSSIQDPISFDTKGANGMTGTLGMRLKLLVLTLHGAYTFAQYPIATVGVGLNIDWK